MELPSQRRIMTACWLSGPISQPCKPASPWAWAMCNTPRGAMRRMPVITW
ncbi:MAG: hypothetical protein R6U96_07880 [Promethearchaeia archaeon]